MGVNGSHVPRANRRDRRLRDRQHLWRGGGCKRRGISRRIRRKCRVEAIGLDHGKSALARAVRCDCRRARERLALFDAERDAVQNRRERQLRGGRKRNRSVVKIIDAETKTVDDGGSEHSNPIRQKGLMIIVELLPLRSYFARAHSARCRQFPPRTQNPRAGVQ